MREHKSKSKDKDIPTVKKIKLDLNSKSSLNKDRKLKNYLSNISTNSKNVEKKELEITSIKENKSTPGIKINLSNIKSKKEINSNDKQTKVIDNNNSSLNKEFSIKYSPTIKMKKQLIGLKIVALDLIGQSDSSKNNNNVNTSINPNGKTTIYESDNDNIDNNPKGSIVSLSEARKNKLIYKQSRSFSEEKHGTINKLQLLTDKFIKSSENSIKKYDSNSSIERDHNNYILIKRNSDMYLEEYVSNASSLEHSERNFLRSKTLKVLSERRFKYKIQKLIENE